MSTKTNITAIVAEPDKQELFITREFNAPPELVFKAHTDPELIVQWLGPRDLTMRLDTFEPVSGGRWRFVHIDQEGNEFGFHGMFHLVSPEKIIQTFEFDGLPEVGHVSLETMTLEALPNGRTRLKAQSVYQTIADRDGMVAADMETGVNEGYEQLDEILEKLQK